MGRGARARGGGKETRLARSPVSLRALGAVAPRSPKREARLLVGRREAASSVARAMDALRETRCVLFSFRFVSSRGEGWKRICLCADKRDVGDRARLLKRYGAGAANAERGLSRARERAQGARALANGATARGGAPRSRLKTPCLPGLPHHSRKRILSTLATLLLVLFSPKHKRTKPSLESHRTTTLFSLCSVPPPLSLSLRAIPRNRARAHAQREGESGPKAG